jgi:UDP-N-acetylmuramyl pentapeptide phosphotransferase/UDP-N-acetylglucosamine-1-phosphate transferase
MQKRQTAFCRVFLMIKVLLQRMYFTSLETLPRSKVRALHHHFLRKLHIKAIEARNTSMLSYALTNSISQLISRNFTLVS